jgi:hypothetical protein
LLQCLRCGVSAICHNKWGQARPNASQATHACFSEAV